MTKKKLLDWLSSDTMRTSAVLHLDQFIMEEIAHLRPWDQMDAYCRLVSEIVEEVKKSLTKKSQG